MASEQESIPVLTQVYVGTEPPVLSPAFFEFAMTQLKPLLDKAIADAVITNKKETIKNEILEDLVPRITQLLNEEMAKILKDAKQSLIQDAGNFLDKTKADLTTEIPQMYQLRAEMFQSELIDSYSKLQDDFVLRLLNHFEKLMPQLETDVAERVGVNLSDLQTSALLKITDLLEVKVAELHQIAADKIHQDLMRDLPMFYKNIIEKAYQDLAEHLKQLQEEANLVLSIKMNETLPSIYELASAQIKTDLFAEMTQFAKTTQLDFETAMKGEVPELEQLLKERIHQAFAGELPVMRQEISTQVNSEIEALIRSVRLVASPNE
jgi:hypothetical protein